MKKAITAMRSALHRTVDPDERHRLTQRIEDHRAGLALLEVHQPKKDTP